MLQSHRTIIANDCSICCDSIVRRTTVQDCGHQFCYDCISQWIARRNLCPLCRQAIHCLRRPRASSSSSSHSARRGLEKIVTNQVNNNNNNNNLETEEEEEEEEELVQTPEILASGEVFVAGLLTVVSTPIETGLIVIEPRQLPFRVLAYRIFALDADHSYYLFDMAPGTLFVYPNCLASVLAALESHGIRPEPDLVASSHEDSHQAGGGHAGRRRSRVNRRRHVHDLYFVRHRYHQA